MRINDDSDGRSVLACIGATTDGGGLDNLGTASVVGSTFTSNSAGVNGGGIFNLGALMQSGNTFTGNHPNDVGS